MVKTKVSDSSGAQVCPDSTTWKELTHQFLGKSELNSSIAHMHIFEPLSLCWTSDTKDNDQDTIGHLDEAIYFYSSR